MARLNLVNTYSCIAMISIGLALTISANNERLENKNGEKKKQDYKEKYNNRLENIKEVYGDIQIENIAWMKMLASCYAEKDICQAEKDTIVKDYKAEKDTIVKDYQAEKDTIVKDYQAEKDRIIEKCQAEKDTIVKDYQAEKDRITEKCQAETSKKDDLIKDLQKDHVFLCNVTKTLTIPRNLRYSMEVFGIAYGHSAGSQFDKSASLRKTMNHIKTYMYQRSTTFHKCASRLKMLDEEFKNVNEVGWNNKVNDAIKDLRNVSVDTTKLDEYLSKNNSLLDLMAEILSAHDQNEANKKYRIQCEKSYWSRVTFDHLVECEEARILATFISEREAMIIINEPSQTDKYAALQRTEKAYLRDLIKTKTFFITKENRHRDCMEIMYFAPEDMDIDIVKRNIFNFYPELDKLYALNKFCNYFSKLYNLISVTTVHAPVNPSLSQECEPDSINYYDYLKRLVPVDPHVLDQFIFVCKILNKISSDFSLTANKSN